MPRSVRKDEAKREIYEYRREVNLKKNLDPLVDFWKGNEGKLRDNPTLHGPREVCIESL